MNRSPLTAFAERLDAVGGTLVAEAARQAARSHSPERSLHPEALRRRALEVAVRLDARGLHAGAQAVFDAAARRDAADAAALADVPFDAWLRTIEARLDEHEARAASE